MLKIYAYKETSSFLYSYYIYLLTLFTSVILIPKSEIYFVYIFNVRDIYLNYFNSIIVNKEIYCNILII